jgi:molybdopterin-binding protein
MAKQQYSASEAAAALGISLDTLRRWDRAGRIRVTRDQNTRLVVSAQAIDRLRFRATVTDVEVEGLMAQVELVVADPVRLVAIVTRDAVAELGLKKGMAATAIVKSTNVIIQS